MIKEIIKEVVNYVYNIIFPFKVRKQTIISIARKRPKDEQDPQFSCPALADFFNSRCNRRRGLDSPLRLMQVIARLVEQCSCERPRVHSGLPQD